MAIIAKFDPDPDITAKELAEILKHLLPLLKTDVRFTPEIWKDLDYGVKRHFLRFK